MTTTTTMAKSMMTTATTVMTDVVVFPSFWALLVGCMLLLVGTVAVVTIAPTVRGGVVASAVER